MHIYFQVDSKSLDSYKYWFNKVVTGQVPNKLMLRRNWAVRHLLEIVCNGEGEKEGLRKAMVLKLQHLLSSSRNC